MDNEPRQKKRPEDPIIEAYPVDEGQGRRKFLPLWTILLVLAGLVCVVLGLLGFWIYSMRSDKLKYQRQLEALTIQTNKAALEHTKAAEDAKLAIAQTRQQEVLAQVRAATNTLSRLLESLNRVNTKASGLRNNEDGRAIALHPDLVAQARRMYESELPALPTKEDAVAKLEGARRSEQQLLANLGTAYNPQADMAVDAQNSVLWAEQALQKAAAVEAFVGNLVRDSRVKVSDRQVTPNSPTLADAIAQLNAGEVVARTQTIVERTKEAKSSATDTIAEAEAKRIIEEAKIQAANILREAERKAATNKVEESKSFVVVKKAEDEATRIRLREKASRPDIQSRLAPFLSPGYYVPTPGTAAAKTSYEKGPMPFSKLREAGALEPSMDGLRSFIKIGTSAQNDRPHFSREFNKPQWYRVQSLMDEAKELQQLMIELGPTFIEMKLLNP